MATMSDMEDRMQKIVSLAKRRGFIFPGSEIYGGLANSWDYGPLGVELKNNIKQDRFTIFVKGEQFVLVILENILLASSQPKKEKVPTLEYVSLKLNMLRIFIRLMKDIKTIDPKKYVNLEGMVDEIGRMLGGWIRSMKQE